MRAPLGEGGEVYELVFDLAALRMQYRPPGPLNIPLHLLGFGLLGGLLFSATLAWYLTQPIGRLRDGFGRLAQGHLEVRLGQSMGRRRDELSDLARDFDSMAERLQQLVADGPRFDQYRLGELKKLRGVIGKTISHAYANGRFVLSTFADLPQRTNFLHVVELDDDAARE